MIRIGLVLIGGLIFGADRASATETVERPNVLLIIADDLGWDDTGAFGHPKIKTSNIDKLAREGLRFDRAFVTASSCSPSRSSQARGPIPEPGQHDRPGAHDPQAGGV